MARNCMHGLKVLEEAGGGKAGTELRLSFEAKMKSHWIRDWIVNHPRVVIPAVAAATALIAAAVFGMYTSGLPFPIKSRYQSLKRVEQLNSNLSNVLGDQC